MREDTSKWPLSTMSTLSSAIELYALQLFRVKTYLILAVVTYVCFMYMRSRRRLPPGPWGLPVVGYLPFLSQKAPHFQLEELRKKYGNVFGMYLGSRFTLFLGDLATSKEGYNMDEFSGRPEGAFPISRKSTHFAAINGQPWKIRRKLSVKGLRLLGIGTDMVQDMSRSQMNIALDRLEAESLSSPSGSVNVRSILTHTTTSVILKLVCGKYFPPEDKSYKIVERFLKFFAENGEALSLDITMPWTKPFLNMLTAHKKESLQIFDDMENFTRSEIESHLRNQPDTPQDMLDFYLRHFESKDENVRISDISGDAQLIIFAGGDTVRGTAEWFLLCMAQYPKIQEKVYREIESVLGQSGEIRFEDKHQFPYTEATIFESMRYRLLLPINPYHACLQDTKFHGYDIPEGSLVFALLWSIHNDPAIWKYPEEFYPAHFLSEDKSTVEIPEAFLPFSPGKRTCMGDKVALIETYLFCVSLVRRFSILPPDDGLNLEGNLRLNMEAHHPVVKLVRRSK